MKVLSLSLYTPAIYHICRIFLALSALAWSIPAPATEPPCLVVNGPTSDQTLTNAKAEWTQHVIERLKLRDVDCEAVNIEHWARANKMFRDGTADVLFPEIVGDPEQPGITGMPIARTYGFVIFTRYDTGPLNTIESLEGLRVGTIRGRFYPSEFLNHPGIQIQRTNSLEQNMHMLALERIDATIEYQSDGVALLSRLGLRAMIHHGDEFGVNELAYRFHLSDRGIWLRHHFDAAVQELIEDGTYQQTFAGTSQRLITD